MKVIVEKEKILEIEAIEKKFFHLKRKNRARARRKYFAVLRECGKSCLIDEPIYIDRI